MTETSMKPDLQNIGKTGQFWQNIQYIIGQAKNIGHYRKYRTDTTTVIYIFVLFLSIYIYLYINLYSTPSR